MGRPRPSRPSICANSPPTQNDLRRHAGSTCTHPGLSPEETWDRRSAAVVSRLALWRALQHNVSFLKVRSIRSTRYSCFVTLGALEGSIQYILVAICDRSRVHFRAQVLLRPPSIWRHVGAGIKVSEHVDLCACDSSWVDGETPSGGSFNVDSAFVRMCVFVCRTCLRAPVEGFIKRSSTDTFGRAGL